MNLFNDWIRLFFLATAMVAGFLLIGCSQKETILDIDTPSGGVEVERSTETGEVSVDVDKP